MKWFHCDYLFALLLVILSLIPPLRPFFWVVGLIIGIILFGHTLVGPNCPVCKVVRGEK
ncbi:MAG: hypothetical protein V2G48_05240 [bacterium JZ-2024 1]